MELCKRYFCGLSRKINLANNPARGPKCNANINEFYYILYERGGLLFLFLMYDLSTRQLF